MHFILQTTNLQHNANSHLKILSSTCYKLGNVTTILLHHPPTSCAIKTAKKLAKLNEDCNMTARLEAKLLLAVGVWVILRCNTDMNTGLVNGAIGTVFCLSDSTCHRFSSWKSQEQIENFLHLQEVFFSSLGIRFYHPQVPRLVIRLCHSGPLTQSV